MHGLLRLLALWSLLCALPAAAALRIDAAEATLRPDGQAEQTATVRLRHRWDNAFPGLSGSASYRLQLPALPDDGPQALLLERAGNQLRIGIDGQPVAVFGAPGATGVDAGKRAHLVPLPAGARELRIDATMQPLRGGGLSPVHVGPRAELEARLARHTLLGSTLPAMYAAGLVLMGGLALGLWWRQRDRLYGCFGLAALCGSLRHVDRIWYDVPVPWMLWGGLLAVAYGCHLALIARFVVLVAGPEPAWLRRPLDLVTAATAALAMLSFGLAQPWLWTAALGLLEALGIVCFGIVLRAALSGRHPTVWWVLGAGTLLLAAGLHDILAVRVGTFGWDREPLSTHALFFFVLLLAGIVVARYSASVAEAATLNRELSHRVAEREAQLHEAFEALRSQREKQAAAQERQRIMRDIHDGVGSHLVGLLSLVRHREPDLPQLEQHVAAALDELRMAVDALQPVHGDLATVLATLRYRLQPRLQAAGLQILWDVEALPPRTDLSPQAVLQVQRILLEAFTNVIRHAGARSVTVRARCEPAPGGALQLVLSLRDDGVGLGDAAAARGQGLASMRARAAAIGAEVEIAPAPGGGTCVSLRWPLAADDAAP